ncbi:MAG: FAD-dependent oxidoreductase [Negativicutes bacterium]
MSKIVTRHYDDADSKGYNVRTAMEEATRCLLCHDEPCSKACPAGTEPGRFIRSIRFRNFKGAAEIIREANVLGGCCARICPAGQLCEGECSRTGIDRPIDIRGLQRFAIEQEQIFGMETLKTASSKNQRVACVGAGPASLACAAEMAKLGYQVEIFEKMPLAGGMMSYGITPARLPQAVIEHDIAQIIKLGVKIHYGHSLSEKLSISELRNEFAAIFIGVGLWCSRPIEIEGGQLTGVYNAIDYLARARTGCSGFTVGNDVVVIGGGDTAMDCAATAKMLGAANVTIVYRRTVAEAPADIEEVENIQAMDISIITRFKPLKIEGQDKVSGFIAQGTDDYSQLKLKADQVVFAIGQLPSCWRESTVKLTVDEDMVVSTDGLFAGGDIVNGGSTVVQAVADGKKAARSIAKYLEGGCV